MIFCSINIRLYIGQPLPCSCKSANGALLIVVLASVNKQLCLQNILASKEEMVHQGGMWDLTVLGHKKT